MLETIRAANQFIAAFAFLLALFRVITSWHAPVVPHYVRAHYRLLLMVMVTFPAVVAWSAYVGIHIQGTRAGYGAPGYAGVCLLVIVTSIAWPHVEVRRELR